MFTDYMLEFFNTYVVTAVMVCLIIRLILLFVTADIPGNVRALYKNVVASVLDGTGATLIIGTLLYCGNGALILVALSFLNAVVYPTQYTR
jgi:hypothetical protein